MHPTVKTVDENIKHMHTKEGQLLLINKTNSTDKNYCNLETPKQYSQNKNKAPKAKLDHFKQKTKSIPVVHTTNSPTQITLPIANIVPKQ